MMAAMLITLASRWTLSVAVEEPVTWRVVKGVDNLLDLKPCCTTANVSVLKAECIANKWCAGFSSHFGTLKYDVTVQNPQANNDMYIRSPPPPPLPTSPKPFNVWPLPSTFTNGSATVAVDTTRWTFSTASGVAVDPTLTAAFKRYAQLLRRQSIRVHGGGPTDISEDHDATLVGCAVNVHSTHVALVSGVDESYTLYVPSAIGGVARIVAETVWGALHGLETLLQLTDGGTTIINAPIAITDAPRFPHRGLMIDTARHFLPVGILLKHLDAMEASKMNVLHWHLMDQQSEPVNFTSLPLAALHGAYDVRHATYSGDDVRRVVAYANARGVQVIPEVDIPGGHSSSLLRGYPDIGAGATVKGGHSDNLDPSNPATWKLLTSLLTELASLFPSKHLHLGFDEVSIDAWNTTTINAWMGKEGLKDYVAVESYFLNRLNAIAGSLNKTVTIWDDPVQEGVDVPKSIQLQVWNEGATSAVAFAKAGYTTILSNGFYLDNLSLDWRKIYVTDLDGLPPLFVGAEAAMWGEHVDATNALARVWPRAAALGELLWSPGSASSPHIPSRNVNRLARWGCRMHARGVPAEPVQPGWCPEDAE
tara:strand:- start:716 stop:2494 length:1779 start_codon:yes stop_codon:yes gene_type:complete